MRKFTITAHTGNWFSGKNTVESVRSAVKHGADIVEFDLMYREDGTPVMQHTPPVTAAAETVESAFAEIAKTKLRVNIDVKDPAHIDTVMALAEKYGIRERCFFTGVDEKWVRSVRAQCGENHYFLNVWPDRKRLRDPVYAEELALQVIDNGAVGLNCLYIFLTPVIIRKMHEKGLLVSAWTVDFPLSFFILSRILRVDNITTHFPPGRKRK